MTYTFIIDGDVFIGRTVPGASRSGRCVLGGCVIGGDDPTRECRDCGYRWVEAADLGEDEDPAS